VKECHGAVAEVVCKTTTKQAWSGIQSYSNFEFTDAGIRVWKAYDIGSGKLQA